MCDLNYYKSIKKNSLKYYLLTHAHPGFKHTPARKYPCLKKSNCMTKNVNILNKIMYASHRQDEIFRINGTPSEEFSFLEFYLNKKMPDCEYKFKCLNVCKNKIAETNGSCDILRFAFNFPFMNKRKGLYDQPDSDEKNNSKSFTKNFEIVSDRQSVRGMSCKQNRGSRKIKMMSPVAVKELKLFDRIQHPYTLRNPQVESAVLQCEPDNYVNLTKDYVEKTGTKSFDGGTYIEFSDFLEHSLKDGSFEDMEMKYSHKKAFSSSEKIRARNSTDSDDEKGKEEFHNLPELRVVLERIDMRKFENCKVGGLVDEQINYHEPLGNILLKSSFICSYSILFLNY